MIRVNKFKIYINVYVHYPEVYNETIIGNRLNQYFKRYFLESDTYIKFYTAPIIENQIMVIETTLEQSIDIDKFKQEWNEFLLIYFDHQIKEIIYKINYK